MLLHFYALGLILLALLPAVLMIRNLPVFYRLPVVEKKRGKNKKTGPKVSILIPARNEEASIGECLSHALNSDWQQIEVLVMDDNSTDQTYSICEAKAKKDKRLKVKQATELPMGWNGKQRSCWQLALLAEGEWLLFIDADVRLSRDAVSRLVTHAQAASIDLLSGFPKQVTKTWSEKLFIPLMHFILLGYLPLERMRASTDPRFAAGCGQLFLARRTAYMTCEGHKSISNSRHDGLQLPKSFRKQRLTTDLFDASDIATCRMYDNVSSVVRGLLKNATEGIANPKTIGPFTILLAGAAVLPVLSLAIAAAMHASNLVLIELAGATALSFLPRVMATLQFRQSWFGTLLHPLGVFLFLCLQWTAMFMEMFGMRITWRGRT